MIDLNMIYKAIDFIINKLKKKKRKEQYIYKTRLGLIILIRLLKVI